MTTPDHLSRVVAVVARELRALSTTYAGAPGQRGLVEIAEDLERAAKLMPPSGPPGSVLGVRPDGVVAWGQPVVVERHDGTGWGAPFFRLDFPDVPKVAEPAPAEAPTAPTPASPPGAEGIPTSAGAARLTVREVECWSCVKGETVLDGPFVPVEAHKCPSFKCPICEGGGWLMTSDAAVVLGAAAKDWRHAAGRSLRDWVLATGGSPHERLRLEHGCFLEGDAHAPKSSGEAGSPRAAGPVAAAATPAPFSTPAAHGARLVPISDWRPTSPAPETDGRSTT